MWPKNGFHDMRPWFAPDFKSAIPPHLVNKLSEQEKYLVETLSRMESQNAWLIDSMLDQNRAAIETDVRVQVVEDWKSVISGKWAIVAGFILICVPIVITKLIGLVFKSP